MEGGRRNPNQGLHRVRSRLAFPRSGHIRHENTMSKCRREMMTFVDLDSNSGCVFWSVLFENIWIDVIKKSKMFRIIG